MPIAVDDEVALTPASQPVATASHVYRSATKINLSALWHCRVIIREPSWRLQVKGADVLASTRTGAMETITGKLTKPCFKLDQHQLLDDLRVNTHLVDRIINRFTIVDSEDGFRLIHEDAIAAFSAEIDNAIEARKAVAAELDANFPQIVAEIRNQYEQHFHQIEGRIPTPPFFPRLEIVVRVREITGSPSDRLISDDMSPAQRQRILNRLSGEAEQLARARVEAIVDGVMGSVIDIAQEINGEKPNPRFDPNRPIDSDNRPYLPGIDSGAKKSGFLDGLFDALERVSNFRTLIHDPKVLDQVTKAMGALRKANSIHDVNRDGPIRNAIKTELTRLGEAMRAYSETVVGGRNERDVLV